jgi:multicomponent Na+:H+ antiporter subunit D
MLSHLPILQVILPLIGAPICLLLRRPRASWALATVIGFLSLAIAITLLVQVLDTGTIRYQLGDWVAPWGIEYVVDPLNAFILVIVSAIGAFALPYALKSVASEVEEDRIYLFYTLYLLCLAGLLGITITGDAFNIFVFLEISSLSSYTLISLGRNRKAIHAAYQYLIMGTIGATFFLIGVGLLYMMTGTLNMADLAVRIPPLGDSRIILAAFGFITVGLGLKLAAFPLHLWLPNAYAHAPSAVSVFLAGTATKVSLYVLIRFMYTVFGFKFVFFDQPTGLMLMIVAVAAIIICSFIAIFQENVKRLLAWSSVSQIGYMLLGLGFGTLLGLQAGLLHIFNHALMKAGLFLAIGCVVYRMGSARLSDMHGVGKLMPWTMGAFVVCGLSLIGIPLTAGFVSKWYLVLAAMEKGWWSLVVLIVVASMIAVVYVWRVIEVAYFRSPPDGAKPKEAPLWMLVPTWIMALANIWFGVETSGSVDVTAKAAKLLMGGGS